MIRTTTSMSNLKTGDIVGISGQLSIDLQPFDGILTVMKFINFKKHCYAITPGQFLKVKALAKKLRISESAFIRNLIENYNG